MILSKKIIIGLVVIIVLIGAVITWSVVSNLNKPKPLAETPKDVEDASSTPKDLSLHINNFSKFPKVSSIETDVTNSINNYLADIPRQETPIGVIRQSSYKETPTGDGATDYTFLVDIASLKITYKVSYTVGNTDGRHILYILCPSESEMIYPPTSCKDDVSEN
jgi:hypothetical protein